MFSWQIWMVIIQSAMLGGIALYVVHALKRIGDPASGSREAAPAENMNFREIQSLLTLVSRVLTEHASELDQFERSLTEPQEERGEEEHRLDEQLRRVRMANQKVEQTIDSTIASLIAACGELLTQEQSELQAYRNRTTAFDNTLTGTARETLLAAIATKLIEMVNELRSENAAVREQVAAAKEKTIELMSRAHSAEQTARTDALTQLPNRRSFDETLSDCHAAFERSCEPYAVVLLDLDHFKSVNDRYGHSVGDAVLAMVGRVFLENRRATDYLCRMGGEEFALLLPKCDVGVATLVADRYRQRIEAAQLRANNQQVSVTISCGVAVIRPQESKGRVLERADSALYAAKAAGRNRVCVDQVVEPAPAAGRPCQTPDKEAPPTTVLAR